MALRRSASVVRRSAARRRSGLVSGRSVACRVALLPILTVALLAPTPSVRPPHGPHAVRSRSSVACDREARTVPTPSLPAAGIARASSPSPALSHALALALVRSEGTSCFPGKRIVITSPSVQCRPYTPAARSNPSPFSTCVHGCAAESVARSDTGVRQGQQRSRTHRPWILHLNINADAC